MRDLLRAGGVALIAAKSYYFGVGGSVAAFKALVAADDRFECRTLRTWDDGASNRREVFEIKRRGSAARRHWGAPPPLPAAWRRHADGIGRRFGSGVGGTPCPGKR